uniref:Uncharacterized protein n=1 Tax=Acrobeloides nanus TaxID=290746 RepID=A0A914ENT5_9BILA
MDVVGFPHQVGGHFGLLTCAGHVCKPLNHREFAFYSQMDPRLQPFTVKCCGRIKVTLSMCAEDGTLNMCADVPECHKQASTLVIDGQRMTFRIKKCGKVEAEKATNAWAAQCQSKVVYNT